MLDPQRLTVICAKTGAMKHYIVLNQWAVAVMNGHDRSSKDTDTLKAAIYIRRTLVKPTDFNRTSNVYEGVLILPQQQMLGKRGAWPIPISFLKNMKELYMHMHLY